MSLESDLTLNLAKFHPSAVTDAQERFNDGLAKIMLNGPQWYEVGATKYREMRSRGETTLPGPVFLKSAITLSIPSRDAQREIPCRMFKPKDGPVNGTFLHIHGGGWVLMSEKFQDPHLRDLANDNGLAVISVGYRLAPEDPFPKGPEDCYDVAQWLVDHAEAKLGAPLSFIGGESAGGHLALLTVFNLLETRPQFCLKGIISNFAATDLSFLPTAKYFSKPLVLTPKHMEEYIKAFLPGKTAEQRKDPLVSPFYKDLTGLKLPPALFNCGTYDCLLDDTMMMATKWQMSGNVAIIKLYPGAPHGFNAFPPDEVPASKEFREVVNKFCQDILGKATGQYQDSRI